MPEDSKILEDILDLLSVYKLIKADFGSRSIEEYYNFLIAEEDGDLVEYSSTSQVQTNGIIVNASINDHIVPRPEPVFDRHHKATYLRKSAVKVKALVQGGRHRSQGMA